jgi:hypothetical protein
MTSYDTREQSAYQAPQLTVLGSVHDLTLEWCFFNKTLGKPDYWNRIPIANCSS